jgi:hypothetical protein
VRSWPGTSATIGGSHTGAQPEQGFQQDKLVARPPDKHALTGAVTLAIAPKFRAGAHPQDPRSDLPETDPGRMAGDLPAYPDRRACGVYWAAQGCRGDVGNNILS